MEEREEEWRCLGQIRKNQISVLYGYFNFRRSPCQEYAKSETNRAYLPRESTEFDQVFCSG
jgi:hypothetical protein